ncbi:MAG: DNA gyrase subunit A [Ruminococcaceae bacterium]|nr:DNA gyrase subunit A [Oscillospiraceae bacterium]
MFNLENEKIIPVEISREMKTAYIDYAMSVIIGRALPDVRDGLKPVHRRILYTMNEDGITADKAYRKCATTVGDVLGRYHPHGDASVYDALVRLAQDFSLRYPLIDGQGNFGSVDGDPPAAYRYTEARMARLAQEMVADIEKETVDFMPNFDERLKEPVVLPSRFPNLLVNGSSGIAVGMATNIPPHNLGEIIQAIDAMLEDPEVSIEELMEIVKGPDFPTAGLILGRSGIRSMYTTGKGHIIMRARAEVEEHGGRERIVVTEIPYQVNKARLIQKIADLVKEKRIEGISDLRDESDREGMRIVIELKKDASGNIILNQLYKNTQMQETFGAIMLAIVGGQPQILNLKEMLMHYIDFQEEVIRRRTAFDKKKAEARAHILEGLRIALDHIDEIIRIIRQSYDDAKPRLMEAFGLSEVQAQAILDMRLARLQGLEREKIDAEYKELLEKIAYYTEVLANESMVKDIIREELDVIKNKYGDERRTEITAMVGDIDDEDMIDEEECVFTLTHFGYIKRIPANTYRSQRRGGRGISGLSTREEDFVETLFTASTHAHILFFTNRGRMYHLKGYQIPEAGRQAKGTAIVNLLPLGQDEKVMTMLGIRQFEEDTALVMATKAGTIKKTMLSEFNMARKIGLNAIGLNEGDELISVHLIHPGDNILIGTHNGMAIRFKEADVRPMGRNAHGVRAIKLREDDRVIGMTTARDDAELLVVTEKGFGKRTTLDAYKIQNRGGLGIRTYKLTEQTGNVVSISTVTNEEDVMMITSEGIIIRLPAASVSSIGRNTRGVRLIRMEEGTEVVSVALTEHEEAEEEEEE